MYIWAFHAKSHKFAPRPFKFFSFFGNLWHLIPLILKLKEFTSKSALAAKLERFKVQKKKRNSPSKWSSLKTCNFFTRNEISSLLIFNSSESLSPADSKE